jgi:hypothetical protein
MAVLLGERWGESGSPVVHPPPVILAEDRVAFHVPAPPALPRGRCRTPAEGARGAPPAPFPHDARTLATKRPQLDQGAGALTQRPVVRGVLGDEAGEDRERFLEPPVDGERGSPRAEVRGIGEGFEAAGDLRTRRLGVLAGVRSLLLAQWRRRASWGIRFR